MAEPGPVGSDGSARHRPVGAARGRQDLKLQMAPKAPDAPAGAVDRDVRTAPRAQGGNCDRSRKEPRGPTKQAEKARQTQERREVKLVGEERQSRDPQHGRRRQMRPTARGGNRSAGASRVARPT